MARKPKTMSITLDIPEKRITDLLHGHGGTYSPWMHKLSGAWTRKHGALVRFDVGEEGDNKGRLRIGRVDVMKGLAIMAVECPNRWSDFMQENDDDLAFDCAWQCILYGKLVWA